MHGKEKGKELAINSKTGATNNRRLDDTGKTSDSVLSGCSRHTVSRKGRVGEEHKKPFFTSYANMEKVKGTTGKKVFWQKLKLRK